MSLSPSVVWLQITANWSGQSRLEKMFRAVVITDSVDQSALRTHSSYLSYKKGFSQFLVYFFQIPSLFPDGRYIYFIIPGFPVVSLT